jgi:hypothetical protein
MKIPVDKDLVEELVHWLSQPQSTGGNFPMETHRAESEDLDWVLAGLKQALKESA